MKLLYPLIILLLSCSTEPEAEVIGGGISGIIKNENGNPISNASIIITYASIRNSLEIQNNLTNNNINNQFYSYPNSTQGMASIKFYLEEESNVKIWITNICDDEIVIELINEDKLAGYHSINWDSKDVYGKYVVDGIYFLNITTDEFEDEFSMVVNRFWYKDYNLEELNEHTTSDENGFFNISLDCLSFGRDFVRYDDNANILDNISIEYNATIWVKHQDYIAYETGILDVDPVLGVNIEIILP